MSNKSKGGNAERELLRKFVEHGWRAARVAGSGVNDESPCDLIAGKLGRKYSIECKSSRKKAIYISKEQISDFIVFSEILGLVPIIALRFIREGWLFVTPDKLKDTGKYYVISLNDAKKDGEKFIQFFY